MHPIVSINNELPDVYRVLVGIGSNLGDRLSMLKTALDAAGSLPGTRVTGVSSLYSTRPVKAAGGDFLNAVAVIETGLTPHKLLSHLKAIEKVLGRTGSGHDARPADLDILFFGSRRVNTPDLQIPHRFWKDRHFVLVPLGDVCGDTVDPVSGQMIRDMDCMGQKPGKDIDRICGPKWYDNLPK